MSFKSGKYKNLTYDQIINEGGEKLNNLIHSKHVAYRQFNKYYQQQKSIKKFTEKKKKYIVKKALKKYIDKKNLIKQKKINMMMRKKIYM